MLKVLSYTFNPVAENTYVLYNEEKEACIIDPGCYFTAEREELKTGMEKTGIRPIMLLNTHCHLDHVFGNKFVHDTWGLELHIHEDEKKLLDYAPVSGEQWGLPFETYQGPLHYIRPGNLIRVGTGELEVFFTPGHSPGSVSFYQRGDGKEPGFIIGGDVLFRDSIGRTDLPFGDFDQLGESIRTVFYTLPDDTVVFPGHGPVTTVGYEKRNNPFVKG